MKRTLSPSLTDTAVGGADLINLYGSGPLPIESRDGAESRAAAKTPAPVRMRLAPQNGRAEADSLIRYVNDFGQGAGSARDIGGDWWLELSAREDAALICSQFRDLLAEREGCHGRALR